MRWLSCTIQTNKLIANDTLFRLNAHSCGNGRVSPPDTVIISTACLASQWYLSSFVASYSHCVADQQKSYQSMSDNPSPRSFQPRLLKTTGGSSCGSSNKHLLFPSSSCLLPYQSRKAGLCCCSEASWQPYGQLQTISVCF